MNLITDLLRQPSPSQAQLGMPKKNEDCKRAARQLAGDGGLSLLQTVLV